MAIKVAHIAAADTPYPAVTAPTPIYAMGSVIQMAWCLHNFRAAAKVITTVDAAIIE
jgi:hypothetical protein